jgi:hypothetical protein
MIDNKDYDKNLKEQQKLFNQTTTELFVGLKLPFTAVTNDSLKNFVKVANPQLKLPTEFMLRKEANQAFNSNREQLKSPLFHAEPKAQASGLTPKEITYLYDERNDKSINRCCLCLSSNDKSFSSVFSNNGDAALKIFLISGVKVSNKVS